MKITPYIIFILSACLCVSYLLPFASASPYIQAEMVKKSTMQKMMSSHPDSGARAEEVEKKAKKDGLTKGK